MWNNNRNCPSLLVGIQNGTAILQNSLAVSYKAKHTVTIRSSNLAPWYLSKELKTCIHENICTWKFTAAIIYIFSCQKLEATKMFFNVNAKTNCSTSRQLFSAIKKWAIKPWNDMQGSLSASYKVKEAIWKDYVLYDSDSMAFWKSKMMETVKKSEVARDWGRKWWIGRAQRMFRAVKTLYMISVMNVYHCVCLTICDPMDCSFGMDWAPLSVGFSRQGYWSGLPCPWYQWWMYIIVCVSNYLWPNGL